MREPRDDPITASVIRVLGADGRTAGTGFVVGDGGLAVTCAHVVRSALGLRDRHADSAPEGEITVQYLISGDQRRAAVRTEFWRDAEREDVAVLDVAAPVPAGVRALALKRTAGSEGNRFSTYGFPEELSKTGLWGYGRIGGLTTDENGVGVLQLAETTETSPGFSGGPVVDQVSGRAVGMVNAITPVSRYGRLSETAFATPTETLREVCPFLRVADVCPYRGLEPFGEEHASFFYGRQRVVDRLLAALRGQPRCLAVLGPSGSGKSSVVRAGLIPSLRRGAVPGSARWAYVLTRPADLDVALPSVAGTAAGDLEAGVRTWLSDHPEATTCVLVLDQLEEIFATAGLAARQLFGQLAGLLSSSASVSVIFVMRDDFYGRLASEAPVLLDEWLVPALSNIPARLEPDELRQIVERPARAVGLRMQEGLVDDIVDDALEDRAAGDRSAPVTVLPLLQFALTQLWERQDDGLLFRDAYRTLGGVAGGLVQWADRAYFSLTDEDRTIARRLFSQLVHLGDETAAIPDSRQKRSIDDLRPLHLDQARLDAVVGQLVNARLLVTGREEGSGRVTVELIHDSLLREWSTLKSALRTDRAFLEWRQDLEVRMRASARGQPAGADALDDEDRLRGRELRTATAWLHEREDDLTPGQRAFIRESIAASQREQERERQLSEDARRERLVSDLRRQADDVLTTLPVAPLRALAAAVSAARTSVADLGDEPLASVQAALHRALRTARERHVLTGHEARVNGVAFSPRGQLLATAGSDRTVRLWDLAGHRVGPPFVGHDDFVSAVAFRPDGRTLASASGDGTVRVWDLRGRPAGSPIVAHEDFVTSVAFGPDGRLLASASADGTVRVWDSRGRPAGPPIVAHEDFVTSVAFSPDGRLLASASGDGTVRLWDLHGEPHGPPIVGHEDFVTSVAFSPDGRLLASAGGDGTVRLWDLHGEPLGAPIVGHEDFVTSVAFSADGTAVVSASEDRTVRLWDLSGAAIGDPLVGHGDAVECVAVSHDDRFIASAGIDRTARLFDWRVPVACGDDSGREAPASTARAGGEVATHARTTPLWDRHGDQQGPAWLGHENFVGAVAFSPLGELVASAGGDRALRLWALDGSVVLLLPRAHEASITSVAFSPDGTLIATGGRDTEVRLRGIDGSAVCAPLVGHESDVTALAFSPDGQTLVSGGRDRVLRLWSLDGAPLGSAFAAHRDDITAVACSPDGQTLVSGGRDRVLRLWSPDCAPIGSPLVGHEGDVTSLAFSPDGNRIVSGSLDRSLRLWGLDGTAIGDPFQAHTAGVNAVCWSPRVILSAGDDATVRIWNERGEPVTRSLRGHRGRVLALASGCHGRCAVSGGADGSVRLWQAGSWRDWAEEACARLAEHGDPDAGAEAIHGFCTDLGAPE